MNGRMYPDDERHEHYQAAPEDGLKGEHRFVEVRYDDASKTTVDEIVTTQLHLEVMSNQAVWMNVCGVHVWINTRKGKLTVTCFADTATPVVVQQGRGR